jgi:hypothetical protein
VYEYVITFVEWKVIMQKNKIGGNPSQKYRESRIPTLLPKMNKKKHLVSFGCFLSIEIRFVK